MPSIFALRQPLDISTSQPLDPWTTSTPRLVCNLQHVSIMLSDNQKEPLDLEPEVFPANRVTLSLQSGFEGSVHSISLAPWLLVLVLVVFCGIVLFGLLNAFANPAGNDDRLILLEEENRALKAKLELYAATVDSINARLDSLKLETSSAAQTDYPYYSGGAVSNSSFSFAAKEKQQLDDIEGKLITILRKMGMESVQSELQLTPENSGPIAIPSIYPAFGRISDGWGMRVHPITNELEFHYGIDISNLAGTPIYATADGAVVAADYDNGYGKRIILAHSGGYHTLYAHLYNHQVRVGDLVNKGQIIGLMGSTGLSTGPHLHYEVHVSGQKVNPANYLNRLDDLEYALR